MGPLGWEGGLVHCRTLGVVPIGLLWGPWDEMIPYRTPGVEESLLWGPRDGKGVSFSVGP